MTIPEQIALAVLFYFESFYFVQVHQQKHI